MKLAQTNLKHLSSFCKCIWKTCFVCKLVSRDLLAYRKKKFRSRFLAKIFLPGRIPFLICHSGRRYFCVTWLQREGFAALELTLARFQCYATGTSVFCREPAAFLKQGRITSSGVPDMWEMNLTKPSELLSGFRIQPNSKHKRNFSIWTSGKTKPAQLPIIVQNRLVSIHSFAGAFQSS